MIQDPSPGHDATAQAKIADRIMSDADPSRLHQFDILVVHPDGVNDHHALIHESQIVHILDQ